MLGGISILEQIPSLATTFLPVPFSDSVKDAPLIVRGKIGIHYSEWDQDPEGSKRIYTYYEFIPSEPLKGSIPSQPTLMIRELGGEKDGIGMHIPGTAQFEKNEDVVVFLKPKNQAGAFDVHGMIMGKLNVFTDEKNEEYLTGPAINPRSAGPESPRWTLKALRQLIKEQKANVQSSSQTHPHPSTTPLPPTHTVSPPEKASDLQPSLKQTADSEREVSHVPPLWTLALMGIAGGLLLWVTLKTLHRFTGKDRK